MAGRMLMTGTDRAGSGSAIAEMDSKMTASTTGGMCNIAPTMMQCSTPSTAAQSICRDPTGTDRRVTDPLTSADQP
jgi:hypothetical protein